MQAEMELKRLHITLPIDSKPLVAGVDKEILKEWQTVLKPFLGQNNMQFQISIHALSKNLKKLIEGNAESAFDLQQIQNFAQKLQDTLNVHHSFVNSCQKLAGKSGSLFAKIVDIVKIASQYTIKKCWKELSKTKANAEVTDEDFERDGSDLDNLEIKTGGNGPNETEEDQNTSKNDFFANGPQHRII